MPFTIPNSADAYSSAQAAPDSLDFSFLASGMARTGVESGLVASVTGSDMKVALTAGVAWIANKAVSIAAGTVTVSAAHATLARFDVITAGTAGTVAIVTGTPAANPVFPVIASSTAALHTVYVAAAVTTIVSNRLTDKRVFIADPSDFLSYAFF